MKFLGFLNLWTKKIVHNIFHMSGPELCEQILQRTYMVWTAQNLMQANRNDISGVTARFPL